MERVFLDTNVLLDYLLERGENSQYATFILQLANASLIEVIVTDLTIANIAYITRKDINQKEFYRVMRLLRKYISVISIGQEVTDKSLEAEWKDFEDSLQYFSAVQNNASCIITRNIKDFEDAIIPILTPKDFYCQINNIER